MLRLERNAFSLFSITFGLTYLIDFLESFFTGSTWELRPMMNALVSASAILIDIFRLLRDSLSYESATDWSTSLSSLMLLASSGIAGDAS